ncbi:hypothetical protein Cva_00754 [Caedimonas varicaedens]|uniref:Uncharacterized protein n=1 Tax=Caedimonas varicaedens TaxID=1629334 RepID=A0A0K8MC64_9PROT|nr:hypothetical protein Cva_00754 [Caedimonas varicaedens]
MTCLTGQPPYTTYGDLLTTTNNGQGFPEETLVPVQDGMGNNSPMLMSQNAVQFTKVMAVPCWTTEQRPQNPMMGTLGFNTQKNVLEVWNGEQWSGDA